MNRHITYYHGRTVVHRCGRRGRLADEDRRLLGDARRQRGARGAVVGDGGDACVAGAGVVQRRFQGEGFRAFVDFARLVGDGGHADVIGGDAFRHDNFAIGTDRGPGLAVERDLQVRDVVRTQICRAVGQAQRHRLRATRRVREADREDRLEAFGDGGIADRDAWRSSSGSGGLNQNTRIEFVNGWRTKRCILKGQRINCFDNPQ